MQARAAIGSLEQLLRGPDRQIRLAAALALQKIDDPAKPELLKVLIDTILTNDESTRGRAFRRRDHEDALRGLEAIGPALGEAAVPALTALLTGGEDTVKIRVAELLGRMGPSARPAVPAITRLTSDPDPLIREAAVKALTAIR
jgi:HEAT repeat protein